MTARPLPASAAPRAKTLRRNFGSRADVKRVFWLELSNATAGCQFHPVDGPDFCDAVSVSELEAADEHDRRLTRDELLAELKRKALVVTGADDDTF